jgi:D-inositol-3-phosphate glycosyltransferase
MRIVILGPAYPYRGGIADTNESFCRALLKKGHDASIVTFRLQYPNFLFPGKTQFSSDPPPEKPEITRLVNSVNPFNWICTARKINRMKPDLVVVRYWLPFLAPALGSIARLLSKKIQLIAFCDNIIPHEKRFGDRMFTKYFVKPFHGFATMSNTVKDELLEFTQKPSFYHLHPINDNLGTPLSKSEARSHLKLDENGKYILFFGLIRRYKGLDLLLKAMGEKAMQENDIRLIVAGEFYDNPDEYFQLIEKYEIGNRVIIHDNYISAADIRYYFSAADLVTQTYHSASQSGITQLALNFDKPMLVTRVGGLAETVKHGETGYVSSKESTEIAQYIVDFFENKRSENFTNNLRQQKHLFSWDSFCDALFELCMVCQERKN